MITGISHLGVAVQNLEEAREYYRSILGLESSDPIIAGDGSLQVSMVDTGNVIVELLYPIREGNVVAKFLEKRGEGIHHVCYEVDDINAEIVRFKERGMEVIGEPRPGVEGLTVFLHPKGTHGVLVELVEKGEE
ncbi:methylmalonyl-CoA epimerase [Chloroflexota bacterium]